MSQLDIRMREWSSGLFESFRDGKQEFFFVRPADQLNVDGEPFGRLPEGKREPGKTRKIQPLTITHGVAIAVRFAGAISSFAMAERRLGGNG